MRESDGSRKRRLILGLLTAWPLAYVLIFLAAPPLRLWFVARGWKALSDGLTPLMLGGLAMHVTTLVVAGALVLVYAMHLSGTKRVPEPQKLPWLLLLVLASVVSMPVYWALYVWPEPKTPEASPRGR